MFDRHPRDTHRLLSGADALAASTSDFILLAGRVMLGWIFVRSGFGKIFDIAAYGATFPGRGLEPALAYLAVPAEFFGGLCILLGLGTRYAAVVLAIFTVVATLSSHRYWIFPEINERRIQESAFWKNVSILGGFFLLFVTGAGRLSVDRWLGRR